MAVTEPAAAPASPKIADAEKGAAPFVEEPLDSSYDHPSTRPTETPSERGVRRRTTAVTNAAFIVERIDENVLPGSFVAISSSKSGLNGIGITKLADITLYRGLTQALLSPLAGLFGDRVNRVYVIGFASFLWGIMTIAMGLAQNYTQMLAFSCVNGLGLALLIPCVQSLLADYYAPASRGRAFGLLYFTSSLGQMLGTQLSTALGRRVIAGEEGWRFVFHVVGALSMVMALLVLALARDPRKLPRVPRADRSVKATLAWAGGRLAAMGRDVATVITIPTFVVVFVQGIVGMMPWVAMSYWPTYLQLLGFSDGKAGMIASMLTLGTAFGCQLAGFLGDGMHSRFPRWGRVATAQFSVFLSLPGSVLLLKGLPRGAPGVASFGGPAETAAYAATFFFVGLVISWCGTNNSAIFAEIVPPQLRTTVFAFNRCIETSISQVAAKLVALMATRAFHFQDNLEAAVADPVGSDARLANVTALGNALLFWLLVPWFLCMLAYTGLYATLPRDRERARAIGARLEADAAAEAARVKGLSAGKEVE